MGSEVSRGGLLGGIGLFLLGMSLFEDTIKQVGKGWLKYILQTYTNTIGKSIGVGLVQTFLFQSSTIVTMITLGFVGAGIIGMYNGLGVVLGANIGTTLTPWLVYLLGFKIHISQYMLPLIGVGGLTLVMTSPEGKRHKIARFVIGFALLFLGLDYMQSSVEALSSTIDLAQYAHRGIIGFTVVGAIMTTIMQTSSGVTIIALTAVSSGLITLDMALAIVVGANIGSALSTGMMGFLSSTHGQATKKQISLSHMIFNGSTALIVLVLFYPIKNLIISFTGTQDPALVLAIFHTVFNVLLLVIRVPLLRRYTGRIKMMFVDTHDQHQYAISSINTNISEEITQALHTDMGYLLSCVIQYNSAVLSPTGPDSSPDTIELYTIIKTSEEILLSTMNQYQKKSNYDESVYRTIDLYDDLLLDMLASAKYLKDMVKYYANMVEAHQEGGKVFYDQLYIMTHTTVDKVDELLHLHGNPDTYLQLYTHINQDLHCFHDQFGQLIAKHTHNDTPTALVSEIIKTHHYTMLSCQSLIQACYRYKEFIAGGNHE